MTPRLSHLAKMLTYILGRFPDEFGLVPDADGFVPLKELLKVFGEEAGLRHIRSGDLEEILLTDPNPPFELVETRIRAASRESLKPLAVATTLPKLLYTGIRQRAYAGVLEKGLSPAGRPFIILSANREMAERMGRRSDPAPILLTVSVEKCREHGVDFRASGESLYLAEYIPAFCFSGPPLPKERVRPSKETQAGVKLPKLSGSYFPDLTDPNCGLSCREKAGSAGDKA